MRTYLPLLLFYSLATFRLAVMLSEDSGPVRMFSRLRSWLKREQKKNVALKKSDLAQGVECLRCSSVWVATAVAAYAFFHARLPSLVTIPGDIFLSAMALSAAAVLFNRMFPKR